LRQFAAAMGERGAEVPPLQARVTVEPSATHYILTFLAEVHGGRSQRTLEVDSCEAAVEAAALLLVITADPSAAPTIGGEPESTTRATDDGEPAAAGAEPTSQGSADTSATPAATSRAASVPPEEAPLEAKRRRLVGFVGVRGSASSSLAPSISLGGGLALGARLGLFAFGLDGLVEATPLPAAVNPGVELWGVLVRGRGWAGLSFPIGRLRLGPYLGAGVELLQVSASGLSSGGSGSSPFVSGSAGGQAVWQLGGPWALALDLGLTVPFERPAFLVGGIDGPVHQPAPISAEAGIGVNWSFGSQ